MKRATKNNQKADLLDEYDFSKGVRGKYAKRFAEGSNLILLAPDLTPFFPDSESVNEALRALVTLARKSTEKSAG